MAAFDVKQFAGIRNVFPELTDAQFETAMLYAVGIPNKDIALLRGISLTSAKRTLEAARVRFSVSSLSCLRSICQVRLFLHSVQADILPVHTPDLMPQRTTQPKSDQLEVARR